MPKCLLVTCKKKEKKKKNKKKGNPSITLAQFHPATQMGKLTNEHVAKQYGGRKRKQRTTDERDKEN